MSSGISKRLTLFLLVAAALVPHSVFADSRLVVSIPSAEEEAEYVWRTLIDTAFFEQNGYEVKLPKGEMIEALKAKARLNQLSDTDFELLQEFIKNKVYERTDYQAGFELIQQQTKLVDGMVDQLLSLPFNWPFKTYDHYKINLTLYGPGGSYHPDTGSILIFTTPKGAFKQYANPANTLIHEIVHLGIEQTIISQFDVPHAMKERIVDKVVTILFQSELPEYRIQDMGDYRIDPFLKTYEDILILDERVEQALSR